MTKTGSAAPRVALAAAAALLGGAVGLACSDGSTTSAADAGLSDGAVADAAPSADGAPGDAATAADAQQPDGSAAPPTVGGCDIFPADDHWNRDVSGDPVDAEWTSRLLSLVGEINLHPDLGNYQAERYGIPFNVVPETQPLVEVTFDWWPEESDPGPYPFPGPDDVAIEGNDSYSCTGDCHILVLQQGTCQLYEAYACHYDAGWHCGNGAAWDLSQVAYGQRPIGWTSADAAGLPILPGLVRYDEVMAGEVRHAIRFSVSCTRPNYVAPASHYSVPNACDPANPDAPPMGLRVRLKADYPIESFNATARTILQAMKTYGMIIADNGGDFYFQGEQHPDWGNDLNALKDVPVSQFEVVGPVVLQP